ncbi:DUF5961 family protein [Brevundimonas sp. S1H14]|uniref:DUF5961 family protein n=1 Tax=Brevundimonas sp. S1H14 TaxID=3078084 RepID=UPI0039EBEF59
MNDPEQHRYFAYSEGLGRAHGHILKAGSLEAAAVGYTELYSPPVDAGDEIRIFVAELDGGREHCFVIDLGDGQAEPCA